jgi:hypothetical protein
VLNAPHLRAHRGIGPSRKVGRSRRAHFGSRKASAEPRPRLYYPSAAGVAGLPSHERQAHLIKTKSTPNIPRATSTGGRS